MANKPLIVVGIPCYGDVAPEILEDYMRFAFHLGRRMPEYDFHLGIRTKSEQFRARNAIVDAAQKVNADWLLMLDDDMVINTLVTSGPTEAYDFLRKMIAHDKDVCGALYFQRVGNCMPVLMKANSEDSGYRFLREDELEHRLQRVDVAGGGCLLIKMRVFDKIKAPYFEPEFQWGTDIQLCRKAIEKGMEVWADTSIELGHLRQEKTIVTSRNRRQFLADNTPGEVRQEMITDEVFERLLNDTFRYTGYDSLDELILHSSHFHSAWKVRPEGESDADWYRRFPNERIARQVAFNMTVGHKRAMTEFIIGSVNRQQSFDILDFGCGVGIPAYTLAERGHRVTACDIKGTGTFEFLKWRCKRNKVAMTFHELEGVPNLGDARFDLIIAMDVLEHIPNWKAVLRELISHLHHNGFFFCNNGILDDPHHAEHYPLDNKEFISECVSLGLAPLNEITFVKRLVEKKDERADNLANSAI